MAKWWRVSAFALVAAQLLALLYYLTSSSYSSHRHAYADNSSHVRDSNRAPDPGRGGEAKKEREEEEEEEEQEEEEKKREREWALPFHPEGPCRYADPLIDTPLPPNLKTAFTAALTANKDKITPKNATLVPKGGFAFPRMFLMSWETYFKHNPNSSLIVYTNYYPHPTDVEDRFRKHAFNITFQKFNFSSLMNQLRAELPEMETVFSTPIFKSLFDAEAPKVGLPARSDFLRLAMIYLFGGSWFDSDILIMREFQFRNAIPCGIYPGNLPPIKCKENGFPETISDNPLTYDPQRGAPYPPEREFGCAISVLGGFSRKHAFIRFLLVNFMNAYIPGRKGNTLNYYAFSNNIIAKVLRETSLQKDKCLPNKENGTHNSCNITMQEWPNLYLDARLNGYEVDVDSDFSRLTNVSRKMEILKEKKRFGYHAGGSVYATSEERWNAVFHNPDHILFHVWKENCLFTCSDANRWSSP